MSGVGAAPNRRPVANVLVNELDCWHPTGLSVSALSSPCMGLVDREKECLRIDELLDSVRSGLSGVLVVRGQAGVGKTALLDYAVNQADDFMVVRLTGVESERDLGFAALHQLLAPTLDRIEQLPVPQREALSSA